jgi:hypothetical protein
VAALVVGVAAALTSGGDEPGGGSPTGTGWVTVSGKVDAGGQASYQVPGGADWVIHDADFAVSYKGADGRPYASGHSASFYYGNDCRDGDERVAAGWALLADAGKDTRLAASAVAGVRDWARGYGSGPGGTVAPTTEPVVEEVELADGTPAVSARVSLDMTVFEGPCLSEAAEVTVLSFHAQEGVKALVAVRYVGVSGGIPDDVYAGILASVRPE